MAAVFFIGLMFFLVVVILLGAASHFIGRQPHRHFKYELQKPLSAPEQVLYFRLCEALPECIVLAQVSFSRFLLVRERDKRRRFAGFQAINRKTVDYLVCLKDFTVVAAVELDDRTHDAGNDAKRDALLQSAGIPVIRWHVSEMPSREEIELRFKR